MRLPSLSLHQIDRFCTICLRLSQAGSMLGRLQELAQIIN